MEAELTRLCPIPSRFIVGKEEIPNHSALTESARPDPPETTAAAEMEGSQASLGSPDPSRRSGLLALTRRLLESV